MTKRRAFIKKSILGTAGISISGMAFSAISNALIIERNRETRIMDEFSTLASQSSGLPILPAFPGAQGAGSTTRGGRGGRIFKVTTLMDYAEDEKPVTGSLRYALEQEGPRTVSFGIGGTLRLKRPLVVTNPFLTVAGNTAPFPGITITGYPTSIRADQVILRYIRFRLDVGIMRERFRQGLHSGWDSINASHCEYVIFDHLSASHSVDETISFSGEVDHVCVSHSISAYSLRSVFHDYYFTHGPDYQHAQTHNLGGLLAYLGKHDSHAVACAHHNIYAHHDRRMPGLSAGRDDPKNLMSYIDIRNNLMYNWKSNAAGIETGSVERSRYYVNLAGNYFKPGPNTPDKNRYAGLKVMGYNRVYMEANVHDDDALKGQPTLQEHLLDDRGKFQGSGDRMLDQSLPTPPVAILSPPTLKAIANDTVGASIPCRDNTDALVIRDIYEGTGYHPFVDLDNDDSPPVPDLPSVLHVYATDEDPFPVWWKLSQGLAFDAVIDPLGDSNGDGYTNIEAYMYGLSLTKPAVDWSKPENIRNPLEEFENFPWKPGPDALPKGWANRKKNETIYSHSNGLTILASSVSNDENNICGCRLLLQDDGYWTPGNGGKVTFGPDGAQSKLGPALVLAFSVPQKLKGFSIAKPDIDAYASDHDPSCVLIQGLKGWPLYWDDLLEFRDFPVFSKDNKVIEIPIPDEKRNHFAAYRIIFRESRGESIRIQSLSPVLL